jgi:UDP-N-acetylmuramate--alanine ligase
MADLLTPFGPAGPLSRVRSLHVVGAAGAGMSALAKLARQAGVEVSASDIRGGIELASLADLGITTWSGHRPELIGEADLVIVSSAVPEADPELQAARARGIPIWYRPQFLAALTRSVPTIGPSGTHGKTTTSAMLVVGARAAGLDPSFVVGGELVDLATNAHRGEDELLILEADEAFGTFLELQLHGLIITNIEPEHLDYFGGADRLEEAFAEVAAAAEIVLCSADDPGAARIATRTRSTTYGESARADWRFTDLREEPGGVIFNVTGPGASLEVAVPRPGRHIASNATAAIGLLAMQGCDPARVAAGLAGFHGVRRRFEHRGTVGGVVMIDDYAHHPTEVTATLRAARATNPRRLWAVFQPHLFSRTQMLHREFGAALAGADRVVVTDVYAAREAPIAGVSGVLIAEAARRSGATVDYLAHRGDIAGFLSRRVEPGDLVLTMGAGDVTLVPTELAALLARKVTA